MARKLLGWILLLGAIFFCPWPLALAVVIIITIILESMTVALITAISLDWLYGTSDHLALGSAIVLIIFLLARWGRRFIRFNS